ncbi:MAG: hypothetical protein HY905_08535 [Deltaproteobacteria bacterium]|nr:hypothetical protein [Deltaproteobacteria bacterium]
MVSFSLRLCAFLPLLSCAPTEGDSTPDVRREDAGAEELDVPTGALVPVTPPVEVEVSPDRVLGPVLMTTLTGTAAVIWGERDTEGGAWGEPGFAVLDGEGALATAATHLPETGHEPVGLEPHTALRQLAYFTMQRGAGCEVTLHRRMLDTAGRITAAIAEVDTLDDPIAMHTASLSGNAVVMAVEGNACTARTFPAARIIIVGPAGAATGSVPLGDVLRVSSLAARPDGSGYMALRYTDDDGVIVDMLGPGGGRERGWTVVRRDGVCECASAQGVLANSGGDYLAAWAGEVDGLQSWFLHLGPYDDDLEFGADPLVTPLEARFDRQAAIAPFQGNYVVAYVAAAGGALRIDLLHADGTLEEGWSPEVPGEVTHVAVAAVGARVAVAWIEKWAGASAPSILKAGLFAPP